MFEFSIDRGLSTRFNESMLTVNDLDEIEKIVDEKIEARTKNLPTKDEFFGKMDEVMGELKAIREEQPLQSHELSDHDDRITVIEKKLQIQPLVA